MLARFMKKRINKLLAWKIFSLIQVDRQTLGSTKPAFWATGPGSLTYNL